MIPAIKDIDNITKIWKSTIETQCELTNNQVRSLTSPRGQNLTKKIDEYIFETLSRTDVCALFDIDINLSQNQLTYESDDNTILTYIYATIKVIIYGKNSSLLAMKFKARLESSEVRDLLWQQGIYFEDVSTPNDVHEFVNNIVYFRTDMTINFSFRYDVSKIVNNEYFDDSPTEDTISEGLHIDKI